MFIGCKHLRELLESQREIILRHVDRHKWFRHIENREEAILDFVEKFGWIMREFHCTMICTDRSECGEPVRLTGDRLPYAAPQLREQPISPARDELVRCLDAWARIPSSVTLPEPPLPVRCRHLDMLLQSEAAIIERHLERHMWFRHIENREEALKAFVEEFGWLMQELYCGHICDDRCECIPAEEPPGA
ncbi:hypothetical protein JXA88_17130 [Candidatus Fermentibacteria bacterium]|nr:hypothetical protein [Candidatus Fermentibacteria bacterium]